MCFLQSSAGLSDNDEEEFERIVQTPRSNSLSALVSLKSEEKLKCYADPAWRFQVHAYICIKPLNYTYHIVLHGSTI